MNIELLEAINKIVHNELNLGYASYHAVMGAFSKLLKDNNIDNKMVKLDDYYIDEKGDT